MINNIKFQYRLTQRIHAPMGMGCDEKLKYDTKGFKISGFKAN